MKQKQQNWIQRGIAIALILGAVALVVWQGVVYVSEKNDTQTVQRVQPLSTEETAETEFSLTEINYTQTTAATSTITTTATAKTTAAAKETEVAVSVAFPLELNDATAEELEQLPGIGTVLAERIVAYRAEIGGFSYREQLLEVSGIGDVILGQIYNLVYITDEQSPTEVVETTAPIVETTPVQTVTESAAAETTETPVEESTLELPLDLNTATKEELLALPDMTETIAEEILAFRTEMLYYSSVYELLYLDHMTSTYFMELREYVYVE